MPEYIDAWVYTAGHTCKKLLYSDLSRYNGNMAFSGLRQIIGRSI